MRRRAYPAAAVAAAAALALAGCTGSGSDTATDGGKPEDVTTAPTPAASGKYQNLPDACNAVGTDQLRRLLRVSDRSPSPSSADPADEAADPLEGKPTLTYDAHRRVGCDWKADDAHGTRLLSVDFERVVSYSASVSDDERAEDVFATKAEEHGLTPGTQQQDGPGKTRAGGTPSPSGTAPGDDATDDDTDDGADPDHIAPRQLKSPGDEAFLDDQASTTGSAARRTVTVVFRTSNVVVTLSYSRSRTDETTPPGAADLQDKAQQLADRLADRLNG